MDNRTINEHYAEIGMDLLKGVKGGEHQDRIYSN